jgi:anti-anti-sigma factor
MNGTLCNKAETLLIALGDMHELVRGQEQRLLDRLAPVVCEHSVLLDLRSVERIDAAGIAALISVYGCAQNTGHELTVVNASPRVEEILALVGLDRILLSHNAVPAPQSGPCLQRSAA